MHLNNRGLATIVCGLILSSTFIVFKLSGIINCHWAYLLLCMWGPWLVMSLLYLLWRVRTRRARASDMDYANDDKTYIPDSSWVSKVDTHYFDDPKNIPDFVLKYQTSKNICHVTATYLSYNTGILAILEYEEKVPKLGINESLD